MDYDKKELRAGTHCLECGEEITYGRTDKKFCCEECKNRHYNHMTQFSKSVKRRVLSSLERNHVILDSLIKAGIDSVDLAEAVAMGFSPNHFTSGNRKGRCMEVCCFDIRYVLGISRLSGISKIQNVCVTLQDVRND